MIQRDTDAAMDPDQNTTDPPAFEFHLLNFFVIPPRLMRLMFLMPKKPSIGVSTAGE